MTDRAPEREHPWLGRFGRLLPHGAGGQPVDQEYARLRAEELILGGPRRYSRAELMADGGIDEELAELLWRALGFAEVSDDEVVFTAGDRAALRQMKKLRDAGIVPEHIEAAMARSVGQAMAGLADWQIERLYSLVDYGHQGVDRGQMLEIAERVIPLLESMQDYVWRRHVAAAAVRLVTTEREDSSTRTLTVGFADMVGFTRATRRRSPAELTGLLDDFQAITNDVVAGNRGRVVKTVGDEVLFAADEEAAGAEIALRLVERLAESDQLPDLRIGLAVGEVVTRFGDVFGEAVNIAARLTTNAQPGRVMIDRNLAGALGDDPRFELAARRPLTVRGYRHLHQWELVRAHAA